MLQQVPSTVPGWEASCTDADGLQHSTSSQLLHCSLWIKPASIFRIEIHTVRRNPHLKQSQERWCWQPSLYMSFWTCRYRQCVLGNSVLCIYQYTALQEKHSISWNILRVTLLGTGISFWFVEKNSALVINVGAEETHASTDRALAHSHSLANLSMTTHKSHALLWEQMSHIFSPCHKTLCFSSAMDLAIALLSMPSSTLGTRWQSVAISLHSHNLPSHVNTITIKKGTGYPIRSCLMN